MFRPQLTLFGEPQTEAVALSGQFAEIVFDRPLDHAYFYAVPEEMRGLLAVGKRVLAPFGKGNRGTVGYCVGLTEEAPTRAVKALTQVLDEEPLFTPQLLKLTRWMADYYLCGWGQVLNAVVPAGAKQRAGTRPVPMIELVPENLWRSEVAGLGLKQKIMFEYLRARSGPVELKTLLEESRCGTGPLRALIEKGFVRRKAGRTESTRGKISDALLEGPADGEAAFKPETLTPYLGCCALASYSRRRPYYPPRCRVGRWLKPSPTGAGLPRCRRTAAFPLPASLVWTYVPAARTITALAARTRRQPESSRRPAEEPMSLPLSRLCRTRLGLELLEDRCVPASAFSYDPMTQALTITGSTTSTNQFSYDQRAVHDPAQGTYYRVTFTMNGETRQYVAGNGGDIIVPGFSTVSHVTAFGNGGGDTAILTVNDAFDDGSGQLTYLTGAVVLGPRGGELLNQVNGANSPAVDFMDLDNFPTTYIYFTNGLRDTAQLLDSPNADDLFVSVDIFAYMKNGLNNSSAYFNLVSGAASVYSYSSNATDQAYHYVPPSFLPVSFVSSGSAYSYTSGTDSGYRSFFDVAVGFKFNYGIASGTTAIAYIIDSPGDDVFSGNATFGGNFSSSYLYSTDSAGDLTLFNEAVGFNTVYAQSFVGGTDFAYNNDPSHNILGGAWILLT